MKYGVSEEFSDLKKFSLELPTTFDHIGAIIQDNRNVIKRISNDRGTFVVKNFKGMYFLNRLMYSFFRKSKAERSYLYSRILNDNDIKTPSPVAWLDCYKWGLLQESFFISVYYSYPTLREILQSEKGKEKSYRTSLFRDFALFTKKLHDLHIYHKDYSLGNILIIEKPEGFQFALVDLNRVRFGRVSYRKGVRNFITLEISDEDMNTLIGEYAMLSNESPQRSIETFWAVKKRSSILRRFRKKIRRYTLTPLEEMISNLKAKQVL
jgi:hypothetical protein